MCCDSSINKVDMKKQIFALGTIVALTAFVPQLTAADAEAEAEVDLPICEDRQARGSMPCPLLERLKRSSAHPRYVNRGRRAYPPRRFKLDLSQVAPPMCCDSSINKVDMKKQIFALGTIVALTAFVPQLTAADAEVEAEVDLP